MKKLLVGLAALPFLAGVAMAGQPKPLSDAQMDRVTAGQGLKEIEVNSPFAGVFEFEFEPSTGAVIQPGDDLATAVVPNHAGDAPHALVGRLCDSTCSWGNPVGHVGG